MSDDEYDNLIDEWSEGMTMTTEKKTALRIWEDECKALRERMPKVCGNCFAEKDGHCMLHDATPPPDFADTPGACPDWKDVVPF